MALRVELTESEKKLIEHVQKGDIDDVKRILSDSENKVTVDCLDEHGMTPLQHAAYRGKVALCELLLAHGADVNSNSHQYGYTALMFAALAGSVPCTKLMLEHGAKVYHTNSVGRTAAQMAGFVSQHQVVSLINNFVSIEDLEYYTKPQGLEKNAKLPVHLVSPLHKLMLMSNLNPVRISRYLREHKELLMESKNVYRVLQIMLEKKMKQSDTDEVMALKIHYLSHFVENCAKFVDDEKKYDGWIKSLIKENENMFPETQEKFVRSTLRDFPYASSALLRQVVKSVSDTPEGNFPTALSIMTQAINGQYLQDEVGECETCGEPKAVLKCSACKAVKYCNKECQKLHWFSHKKFCKELAARKQRELEEQARIAAEEAEKDRQKAEEEAQATLNEGNKIKDCEPVTGESPDSTTETTEVTQPEQ